MILFPPCKINLGLHVVRKRMDGFHDLETCFYPVPWTDVLEIIPATNFSFTQSGIPIPGDATDNLCVKAYRLLEQDYGLPPVSMHLHKIIPMGAGLGGGSSDAAYVLRILSKLFSLDIGEHKLFHYAAILGSDCAFFIQDEPMLGAGRGEVLLPTNLSLKGKFLLIIKPDVHVSTAEAFAGIQPVVPEQSLDRILGEDIQSWKHHLNNDFERTVFNKHPEIASIKDDLYKSGAIYASMSGSGSAVFGIFDHALSLNDTQNLWWSGRL